MKQVAGSDTPFLQEVPRMFIAKKAESFDPPPTHPPATHTSALPLFQPKPLKSPLLAGDPPRLQTLPNASRSCCLMRCCWVPPSPEVRASGSERRQEEKEKKRWRRECQGKPGDAAQTNTDTTLVLILLVINIKTCFVRTRLTPITGPRTRFLLNLPPICGALSAFIYRAAL